MADEKSFFIQVLSDHLNTRRTISPKSIDWSIVSKLSFMHQVEGIVFCQCKDLIPAKEYTRLEQRYLATLYYYKNRESILANIDKRYSDNSIQYIEVKGFKTARYYPIPGLRTMGDTDLVVHEEDRDLASKILLDMGFVKQYEFTGKERGFSINNIKIELHHCLIYKEAVTTEVQERFFNNCWEYFDKGELNHSFHFLFLMAHLRKHMMNEGVGIRQFMDLAMSIKNDPALDWIWITEKLNELQMLKFAYACFGIVEYWFGIKAPIEYTVIDADFKEKATEKIIKNGVFGFDDKRNKNNNISNLMRVYNGPRWLFRIKMILERAFPGYEFLIVSEQYRFLSGRPWLLPAAWCYRYYLMLNGKTTSGRAITERIMQSNEAIDARDRELRQWGLID